MREDITQEILKELQRSRRSNQVLLAVISIVFLVVTISHQKPAEPEHSWTAVLTATRQLDYPRALSLAQANVALQPNDYYGHSYLGIIYLAMGDVTNSEAQYLQAYELFPSEENEKNLAAIRKRIATARNTQLLPK